jgi:hypothetical protein
VTHAFSPETHRRTETVAAGALIAAAVAGVVVFWPPEGRVLVPLHGAVEGLLGQASFLIPVGLALVGGLGIVRRVHPELSIPRRRILGVALITLALLPAERLMGGSTGLIGAWLTDYLVDLVGSRLTVVAIVMLVSVGVVLVFDITVRRPARLAAR